MQAQPCAPAGRGTSAAAPFGIPPRCPSLDAYSWRAAPLPHLLQGDEVTSSSSGLLAPHFFSVYWMLPRLSTVCCTVRCQPEHHSTTASGTRGVCPCTRALRRTQGAGTVPVPVMGMGIGTGLGTNVQRFRRRTRAPSARAVPGRNAVSSRGVPQAPSGTTPRRSRCRRPAGSPCLRAWSRSRG